jgi:DNA-binding HxlR family transcriptional regulator
VSRSYDQYCAVARALEIVGERWTMLVVRELLLGPRRFTDLMQELPGISTNVLASRLKDLEDAGLVRKRTLAPPAGSTVYELAEEAVGLGFVAAAMAAWGMKLLGPPRKTEKVPARSLMLSLAVTAVLPPGYEDATFELHVDDEVFTVRAEHGSLAPSQGPATAPAAVITAPARTLAGLAFGTDELDRSLARGLVTVEGDEAAARRLLEHLTRRRVVTTG